MGDVVRISGLIKRFGDIAAVDGIDLVFHAGERVGLLGPNGAGKTTTLLLLLGVVAPDEGSIDVTGHRLPKGRSAAMSDVGFAAGYLPLPERLNVDEYLRFYGQLSDVAASFGGADLESVFLRLAARDVPEHPLERDQQTERPGL